MSRLAQSGSPESTPAPAAGSDALDDDPVEPVQLTLLGS